MGSILPVCMSRRSLALWAPTFRLPRNGYQRLSLVENVEPDPRSFCMFAALFSYPIALLRGEVAFASGRRSCYGRAARAITRSSNFRNAPDDNPP